MVSEFLTWEITLTEQRERNQKILIFLLSSLPIFIGIIITATFSLKVEFFIKDHLRAILYGVSAIVGIILLFLVINKFFSYRKRIYYLDNQGITISKGNKKKYYLWNNFECFYQYASQRGRVKSSWYSNKYISEEDIKIIGETGEEIQGQFFHLRKKSLGLLSKLYKIFVVVYAEPDNSEAVKNFLSKHLPQMTMKASTDLGLVFYQFK